MGRGFIVVVAVASALAVAGCGGEAAEPLTKSEFLEQGNAICKKGSAEVETKVDALLAESENPDAAEREAFFEDVYLPNLEQQVEDLAALTPPEADKEEVEALIAAKRDGIEDGKENAREFATAEEDPFESSTQKAEDYGLEECS